MIHNYMLSEVKNLVTRVKVMDYFINNTDVCLLHNNVYV